MKAGFFEKDVTPPVGTYIAGFPNRKEPSKGTDDPLYLRIVAVEDSAGERAVLVTMDLLKFPKDMAWRTKLWCEREIDLKSPRLIINTSHTHSAPPLFIQRCYPQWGLDTEYIRGLEQSIRQGIREAIADLQSVQIRYGVHEAHFGINRRRPIEGGDGKVTMGPNPDGYYDPDLPVLVFYRDGSDVPRAIFYSYACHPTSKNTLRISADWPGQVSQELKRQLGDDVITLFAQGAGASIMPRCHLRDDEQRYRQFWADVADDIAQFVETGEMHERQLQIDAAEKEFILPYDLEKMPSFDQLMQLAAPEDTPLPENFRHANRSIVRLWARDMLQARRTDNISEGFTMHLTRLKLNDGIQIIAMSGEVTAEVGRAVKDLFPATGTVFFGYCSYTDAYIPRAFMLDEGGHEAVGSMCYHSRPAPFTGEIDDIIEREVSSLRV